MSSISKLADKFQIKLAQSTESGAVQDAFFGGFENQSQFSRELGDIGISGDDASGSGVVGKLMAETFNKTRKNVDIKIICMISADGKSAPQAKFIVAGTQSLVPVVLKLVNALYEKTFHMTPVAFVDSKIKSGSIVPPLKGQFTIFDKGM